MPDRVYPSDDVEITISGISLNQLACFLVESLSDNELIELVRAVDKFVDDMEFTEQLSALTDELSIQNEDAQSEAEVAVDITDNPSVRL